jgi:hypothetical protein
MTPPPAPRPAAPAARSQAPHVVVFALAACAIVAVVLTLVVVDALTREVPALEPRHRAEAVCFALAEPPPFTPPMPIQPSAALVRGRFGIAVPAGLALRQQMQLGDEMVLREWTHLVGDFDVSLFWLRLPGQETEHWLVAAWMEGTDLAVCNFRFSGTTRSLSAEEKAWGMRLLRRVLVPEHFRRDVLPDVRLRTRDGTTMPSFGPSA